MARGRREKPAACCKSYGFPVYCASWVPLDQIPPETRQQEEEGKDRNDGEGGGKDDSAPPPSSTTKRNGLVAVLGGGGGEGRSGVPNAIVVTEFDSSSRSLAEQPVLRIGTDSEVPYRMAVHPGGDGVVCSFPKGCRWFEWKLTSKGEGFLTLKPSKREFSTLKDAGLQLALAFNADGSMFATGGEDGHLRVFKWPSMDVMLDEKNAHTTVKDLDFSLDSKFLVSAGQSDSCRVWDLKSLTVVTSLKRKDGEVFGYCKFSQSDDNNQTLYVASRDGQYGTIISWNPQSWTRIGTKKVVRDAICAFDVSPDGRFLAIGTVEGDIAILHSSNMHMLAMVKKAHIGIVTTVKFSKNSRALISASFDSSSRVTLVEDSRASGLSVKLLVFIVLLAVLLYFLKFNEHLKFLDRKDE